LVADLAEWLPKRAASRVSGCLRAMALLTLGFNGRLRWSAQRSLGAPGITVANSSVVNVRFSPKRSFVAGHHNVRFAPKADIRGILT